MTAFNNPIVVVKSYYRFNQINNTTVQYIVNTEFGYNSIYVPMVSLGNYIDLSIVHTDDNRIEYVEQSCDFVNVYDEIPKHWLIRIISAEVREP